MCSCSLRGAMCGKHAYVPTRTAIVCSSERELDSEKLCIYTETSTTYVMKLGSKTVEAEHNVCNVVFYSNTQPERLKDVQSIFT